MKKVYGLLFFIFIVVAGKANNIQISNISVAFPNITFSIQWDNSWNTTNNINPLYPNNWDGAWVFIKYQNSIDNIWKHATVSATASDHTIDGTTLEINTVSDGMGVFIRRSAAGAGNIGITTVTLKLNTLIGEGNFNFRVFGTEVVYIPQGNFQLGDGNAPSSGYFASLNIDQAKQTGGIAAGGIYISSPAVPAAYPMGYNAFYLMKYEISNEQWVDFLNTLTYAQQAARVDFAPNAAANGFAYAQTINSFADNIIKIQESGLNNTKPAVYGCDYDNDNVYNESTDGQNIANPLLSKADVYAYLDWSGLRPMTDLEFEKACRGSLARVLNECAWGSATINAKTRTNLTNGGQPNESFTGTIVDGLCMANSNINAAHGPARCGVFATGSSGRASSGAGFYGNMELSGNAWEIVVNADATGVAYTGNHGDGELTVGGDNNVTGWPSGSLAGAPNGTRIRGGSWLEISGYQAYLSISYRGIDQGIARGINVGGRGARTAQ